MPADLIIYAVIAAGLVFWLRNILGTRHGDERQRENPFISRPEQEQNPVEQTQFGSPSLAMDTPDQNITLPRNAEIKPEVLDDLQNFIKQDCNFDIGHFLSGAESAFILIVEAFAKGDKETLQNLLSAPVYNVFESVINDRDTKGETVSTEIHAVRKMEVLDARTIEKTAYVTIEFTADETCVIKDKEEAIIFGDPDRITEMRDIWVFSRNLKSKDPTWKLVETRDGEEEEHKTPVPDASS